jgi:ABC-2 type transport system ATP-binding protein
MEKYCLKKNKMNQLEIKNLKKTYANGTLALNDISLQLTHGMFGLLGPNGAGKSTLMRTIAGLQKPDQGEIKFNNTDVIANPNFIKQYLGYLPQDFGVYPQLSAFLLLEHLAVLKGISKSSERKEQINALLDKTNLYQYKKKAVSTFSGGMRQRFGIAQALLGNPQIIIVDEPTAGLDPEERNRFNNLLSEVSENKIVILSTHLVEDVRTLCTQMAIINNGQLLLQGKPNAFIQQLEHCIWSKTIHKADLKKYEVQFKIVASKLNAGELIIHIYATDHPGQGFQQKPADLEDVYFTHI